MEGQKVSKNLIQKWLNSAKWSASGGNSQPWKVEYSIHSEKVDIFLTIDPMYKEQRWSPMDVEGMASTMALGALTFGLEVSAAHDAFTLSNIQYNVGQTFWKSEIVLSFIPATGLSCKYSIDDLILRRTNRFKFKTTELPESLKIMLATIVDKWNSQLILSDLTPYKNEWIENLVHLERLRWEDHLYLNSLLEEISFSKENKFGIPADQLGVSFIDQQLLKLNCKYLKLRSIFNFGGQYISSFQNFTNPIKNSGGIFFIQAKTKTLEACFLLGYSFQEVWTVLNKEKYGFQPISVPFIAQGLLKKVNLLEKQALAYNSANNFFSSKLNMDINLPMIGFRTGLPTVEVGKSPRKDIELVGKAI